MGKGYIHEKKFCICVLLSIFVGRTNPFNNDQIQSEIVGSFNFPLL